jgi:acyl-CoA-binding protein
MASSDQQTKFDAVRQKLRRDWRNDNAILQQYFVACTENWKIYKGERSTKQVNRLNAIYRQATIGDSTWIKTEFSSKKEIEREFEWSRLRGMPQDMAKRRYITFLAEIDPLLIDAMPSEKPPTGFPVDRQKRIICAKCNTAGRLFYIYYIYLDVYISII